jgi:hypothetical protein
MDEFIQPPGTPADQLRFERRVDELVQQMMPDAQLDFDKWGSWRTHPVTEVITYGKEGVPTWQEEVNQLRNGYLPARRTYLYNSLTQANGGQELAPQSVAPLVQFGHIEFNPTSGIQDEEYIELTNPNGIAVDISSWRLTGGIQHVFRPGTVVPAGGRLYVSPNVNAFRARKSGPSGGQGLFVQGNYEGHISNHGVTLQLVDPNESVVDETTTGTVLTPPQQFLRISEIMYHPRDVVFGDRFVADDFEFVELVNISGSMPIELRNVRLSQGVDFVFPAMSLNPGERAVVVRNREAFVQRYGADIKIVGEYGGTIEDPRLSNGGEFISLEIAAGDPIQEFFYDDDWFPTTDGRGHSLSIVDSFGSLDRWNVAGGWRASERLDGTPGTAESLPGDFNGDGRLNSADIDLLCSALVTQQPSFDLTKDNVVDRADLSFLVQNLMNTTFGDANLDGIFDSSDLVFIFQMGEYEDAISLNSTWSDGDWNCDGEFSSADLVTAFQAGRYVPL